MYFSIGQIVFQLECEHLSSVVFAYWCPFATIFKCCNLQSHYTFFKCIKLHQILSQFSTMNLAQALDINIFERDYLNFNNPISSKDISIWYMYKVYCREQGQHLMQQKRKTLVALHFFKKISYLGFFLKNQCQKSPLTPSVQFQ